MFLFYSILLLEPYLNALILINHLYYLFIFITENYLNALILIYQND